LLLQIMSIMIWLIVPFCISCSFSGIVFGHIPTLSLRDFSVLSHRICYVIIFDPPCDISLSKLVANLSEAWKHVQSIQFYRFTLDDFMQNGGSGIIDIDPPLRFVKNCGPAIVIPKMVKDRTCLMHSIHKDEKRSATIVPKNAGENFVEFLNNICGTFLTENGDLNATGKRIEALKKNLHNVENKTVTLHQLNRQCASPDLKYFFYSGICRTGEENCYKDNLSSECATQENTFFPLERCEETDKLPNKQQFISEYLFRSKPVIFRKAVHHWHAFRKWTWDFFMQSYGDVNVHVKLSPTVEFEGVENKTLWNSANFTIPAAIQQALDNADLVTVRPAGVEMKFKDFLNLMNEKTNTTNKLFAYLEYTSMRSYFAGLENDVNEMPFVKNMLNLNHLNIWMSDGNTLGKLHFDEYDNFLCQIRGKKQLILFDPHQSYRLYEGHILEAMFTYRNGTFHRDRLLKSTSMTMSPVDITLPDFEKFPLAKNAVPLNCTISEGDVLFLPSFWWHEVQSYPSMWIYEKPKLKIKLPPGASFVDEEQSVLHAVSLSLPKRFLGKPGSSRRGHTIFYSERSISAFMMKKLIVALKIAVWCVFVINNLMVVWMLSNDCNEKFADLSNFTKIFNVEMRKIDTYLNALTRILENLNVSSEICF
ncbi:JmjC domain-containing protein 7, partial [Trichinella sp. T9]